MTATKTTLRLLSACAMLTGTLLLGACSNDDTTDRHNQSYPPSPATGSAGPSSSVRPVNPPPTGP